MDVVIEVVEVGPLVTVQDLGRHGYADLGVPRSGAFDRAALRQANRLVGNPGGAAGLEITLGGLVLRAVDAVTVAVTGAVCAVTAPSGAGWGAALTLRAGATLRIERPPHGLRSYLALRGGLTVAAVLGSRSTDTLSGLGPAPVQPGDLLPVGPGAGSVSPAVAVPGPRAGPLSVRLGPRADWFVAEAPRALVDTVWTVRADSDRVGVRLDGPPLVRSVRRELPSEPVLPGAIQVPGDGRPIIFGPDAPVTGGYPVIAVVRNLDRAAALRPGDTVRFVRAPDG